MKIKEVTAKKIKDSRGEDTIQVIVKTSKGKFKTSAPSGKSKGKYEVKPYRINLNSDIKFINNLNDKISNIEVKNFNSLIIIEKVVQKKIGANSLFALEASLLKALAYENEKELWSFLLKGEINFPRTVGNTIGGGLHSKWVNRRKPDFQEFLFIANGKSFRENVKINKIAYKLAGRLLHARKKNDEGAWETDFGNEEVLNIMKQVQKIIKNKYNKKIDIGVDIASSSFYKKNYLYKNPLMKLNKKQQISYINKLIRDYDLFYIEDALEENDFSGFSKLNKKHMIVGDDLTVTNPLRLKKAVKNKSINSIIVKPNQIGSLLKFNEVIGIAKAKKIKIIISHRSGETMDDTIADLAIGFGVDFIKTGIYGKVREAKLKRLKRIEKSWKKFN